VKSILQDYDNTLCVSAETLRELVVGYNNRSFSTRRWKTCEEFISQAITLGMPLISSDTRFPFYRKQGLQLIFNKK